LPDDTASVGRAHPRKVRAIARFTHFDHVWVKNLSRPGLQLDDDPSECCEFSSVICINVDTLWVRVCHGFTSAAAC
jgi:hypothetical protein